MGKDEITTLLNSRYAVPEKVQNRKTKPAKD